MNKSNLVRCLVGTWLAVAPAVMNATDKVEVVEKPLSGTPVNYVGMRAPLKAGYLIKLPVGSIHPKGWLMKYMELQRDGLTGKLGTVSAWLDKNDNQWLSGNGSHGWEEVPYWLKGYAALSYILQDPDMLKETQFWIDAVINNAQSSGFFGPSNYSDGKLELWAQMIMLWVLQDYYEYSGDEKAMTVIRKYLLWEKNRDDDGFLDTYWENSRGGDNMWTAIWCYNRLGATWMPNLVTKIHNNTADWHQANNLPNWHGVNFAQGFREPAEYYLVSGDESMLEASYNTYNIMYNAYGQMPGGMYAADENARSGYTDPRQGAETCALVEHMASDEIMLAITGDALWADRCEDIAFNTLPAAFTTDFRALRYLTSPNMAVSDAVNHNPSIDNSGPFLAMNPFSSRCCQHNHGQGWPYFNNHLVMATYDNGLATTLYAASETSALVSDGVKVTLTEDTHYPFEGDINFTVGTEQAVSFPLYLRIPAWADGAKVAINGIVQDVTPVAGQYVRIMREWNNGDKVLLSLPMNVQSTFWKKNKQSVSVNYGPLTLSLKIDEKYVKRDSKDTALGDSQWQSGVDASLWPSWEIFADSPWQYHLAVMRKTNMPTRLDVIKKEWPADDFPFSQENVPLEFKAQGILDSKWGFDDTGMTGTLPSTTTGNGGTTEITLIPMGAARLRISAFPRYIDYSATTGIADVTAESKSPVYDLQGRRVEGTPLKKGVYVQDGRKFVVK